MHYGRKSHDVSTFVLEGVLTGLCEAPEGGDFPFFWDKVQSLYANFSKPFQNFAIVEDLGSGSGIIFQGNYAVPRSIDIDENPFATMVPFTVTLDVFEENTFGGQYGIMEPTQETSFQMNEDGTVEISKSTSARSIVTSASAIDNAIDFVQGITGLDPAMLPLFIGSNGIENAILVSKSETLNRLEGSYAVEESWIYDLYGRAGGHSLHQIRTSIDAGDIGVQISVDGEITGNKNSTIENIRADYAAINHFAEAEDVYNDFGYTGVLFPTPIRQQVSENTTEKSITFSVQFNDTITEDPYIVDSISVSWDSESNKHCANANISIRSTDSCRSSKWQKVNDFYNTFNVTEWIDQRLTTLGYDLNFPSKPKSESVSFNEQSAVINLSASVCDKKIIIPEHFADFNYTVQITPAMPIFAPMQGLDCGGSWTVQKLNGKSRKIVAIQGDATILNCATKEDALESLKDYINGVKLVHLSLDNTFLADHNIRFGAGAADKKIYFSFTWNENDDIIFSTNLLNSSYVGSESTPIGFNGNNLVYNGTNFVYNG